MKILIDEDLDIRLRHLFTHDDVFTVEYMGWKGRGNGALLDAAEQNGFGLVITGDKNMADQQNLDRRTIQICVVDKHRPMTAEHQKDIYSTVNRYRR